MNYLSLIGILILALLFVCCFCLNKNNINIKENLTAQHRYELAQSLCQTGKQMSFDDYFRYYHLIN